MNNRLRYVSLAIFMTLNTTPCFSDAETQTDQQNSLEVVIKSKETDKHTPDSSLTDIIREFLFNHSPITLTSLSREDQESQNSAGFTYSQIKRLETLLEKGKF